MRGTFDVVLERVHVIFEDPICPVCTVSDISQARFSRSPRADLVSDDISSRVSAGYFSKARFRALSSGMAFKPG